MPPVNCPRCRRVTFSLVRGLCADCIRGEHDDLERVRGYLSEDPQHDLAEVSAACNVPVDRLIRWLHEGRIEPAPRAAEGGGGLNCRRCGRAITDGEYCLVCRRAVAEAIQAQVGAMKGERERQATYAEMESVAAKLRRKREEQEPPKERFSLR